MSAEVVGIHGEPIHRGTEASVVEILEDVLAMARDGYIIGVAIQMVRTDDYLQHRSDWRAGSGHRLLAAVDLAHHDLLVRMNQP